ncbi:hypothetical protein CHISP_2420 [Chitinispirillum alkaliphilum]|nr:hypothetical protein CHISP_2420 [Chitinispirillum alkaliphilum]
MKNNLGTMKPALAYFAAGIFLWLLRIKGLAQSGLYDHDSVRNYQVATDLANGIYDYLFNHTAPLFNIYLAALVKVFQDYHIPVIINASLIVIALIIFTEFLRKQLRWDLLTSITFLLFAGTSIALVNFSRYFAIEASSFLMFIILLTIYYKSIKQGRAKDLYWSSFLTAALISINYKAILIIPVFILVELLQKNRKHSLREYVKAGVFFSIPFVFFIFVAAAAGLHPLSQIGRLYLELLGRTSTHNNPTFIDTDFLFYFKLFFNFENPFIIIAILLFPLMLLKKKWLDRKNISLHFYLFVIAYSLFIGMSLIPKAPRGILFTYPIFYLFLFLIISENISCYKIRNSLVICLTLFNIWGINRHIYSYTENNYREIAQIINSTGYSDVATIVTLNVHPYLREGIEARVLFDNSSLKDKLNKGSSFILVEDKYSRIAGLPFDTVEGNEIFRTKHKTLLSPYLILEHCEFSGKTFNEALDLIEDLSKAEYHTRVIEVKGMRQ